MSAHVKATSPAMRKGKKMQITTAKGGPEGSTIKRTISGESADLQIKTIDGEIVHLHCLKDKEVSAFKRGGSKNLEELYDIVQVMRIRCRTCGREWFSDGFVCEIHAHTLSTGEEKGAMSFPSSCNEVNRIFHQ